jgi:two-component system sensor histidine kinase VicK
VGNVTDDFYTGEHFQRFFEKSANSLVLKTNAPHFTILAVSNQFLQTTGLRRDNLLGKNVSAVFPGKQDGPPEMLSSFESLDKAIATKARVTSPVFKNEISDPQSGDMEVQYWSAYNEPVLDESGDVGYLIVTANNITRQVLADNEKQNAVEGERNFRDMILQAPVAMCILLGPNHIIQVANAVMIELWGKTEEAVMNKPVFEALPDAKGQGLEQIMADVYYTGKTFKANEMPVSLLRNGKMEDVYQDFVYQPYKGADGQIIGIIAISIDVTEQVDARKKAERAEESLRMAIDAAELGSYYMNAKDRKFVASARLKEFFGYSPDEDVPYEAAINQIHPDYRQSVVDKVEAAFTTGVKFDMEYPVIGHNDGKTRWVRGIGTVQHDSDGEDTYFTGVLNEITERKHDEIRKNDFIGMVSHELKTPLTSLMAIVQVLHAKLKKSEDPFIAGALDKANLQVKKMSSLINGFLNITRLESGKMLINKQNFIIGDLIREVIQELNLTGISHIIELTVCEKVVVKADHDKIGSVLSNLFSNAVKYSPKGTRIEINCVLKGNQVLVSVTDEGLGMKAEDVGKVFDRYYRVKSDNTQNISGFGIGLYLSAEIIQHHGGKIWAESKYGHGSTFYFTLPL